MDHLVVQNTDTGASSLVFVASCGGRVVAVGSLLAPCVIRGVKSWIIGFQEALI